jgi:hypothetical protein
VAAFCTNHDPVEFVEVGDLQHMNHCSELGAG